MLKLGTENKLYPLWTSLIGLLTYAAVGLLLRVIPERGEFMFIGFAIAPLLFGIIILGKVNSLATISLSSVIAFAVYFLVALYLFINLPSHDFVPMLGEMGNAIAQNLIYYVIYGAIMAPSLNGFKSIPFYIVIFGIIGSLSRALLYYATGGPLQMMALLGFSLGLSRGLYPRLQSFRKKS